MRYLNKSTWPFQTSMKNTSASSCPDLTEWCSDRIGKECVDWYCFTDYGIITYAFKDEPALLVFKLTWGKYGN